MQRAIARGDEQTRMGEGLKGPKMSAISSPAGQIVGANGHQSVLKHAMFEPCWVQLPALLGVQRGMEHKNAKGDSQGR